MGAVVGGTTGTDRWRLGLAAAAVVGVAAAAFVTYGPGGESNGTMFVVAAALTVIVAGALAVRRFIEDSTKALIVSVVALALAGSGFHWSGVPVVLGVAGALAAAPARAGERSRMATAAVALGVLAVLLAVGISFLEPLSD